jgi:hypothetical protein
MSKIDNNPNGKSLYKNASCDAFGCLKESTEKIDVNAGVFGTITLHVCKNCIRKFQNIQKI